jgi:hypothetical protein
MTKNASRTAKKTALKSTATGPLSKTVEFDTNNLPELPTYKPPLDLQFEASESLATGCTGCDAFLC